MKKTNFNFLKALFLLGFTLLFCSPQCSAQTEKFPAQFHYNSKSGRFQKGDDVTLTFLLTNIKSSSDYQDLYATFSKQDFLKKVVMSPYDNASNSGLCSFTFRTPVGSPFKPNYLEKVLVSLGVTEIYFDDEIVQTSNIVSHMLTKEKQNQPKESGK